MGGEVLDREVIIALLTGLGEDNLRNGVKAKARELPRTIITKPPHDDVPSYYNPYEKKSKPSLATLLKPCGKMMRLALPINYRRLSLPLVFTCISCRITHRGAHTTDTDSITRPGNGSREASHSGDSSLSPSASSDLTSVCQRYAFVSMTEGNDMVATWVELSTTLQRKYKGMVKMVMVDAVTKTKKVITVDAATKILSPRLMYTQLGLKTQMNDDRDIDTLFNPVLKIHLEAPHSRWLVSVVLTQVSARSNASLKVRHLRQAHVNWQKIEEMKTKDSVTSSGLTAEECKLNACCYNCDQENIILEDAHSVPFAKVYMDLRFIKVPTIKGHKVYLQPLDDHHSLHPQVFMKYLLLDTSVRRCGTSIGELSPGRGGGGLSLAVSTLRKFNPP
ncbi:hypothetical protein GQ600_27918 [Phytophthora cactorum]|nr:hypothetical protein GQ600_27918 [Phytophthora cactorum]